MYRALYRKWRPKTFEDVVGQNDITTALRNQIQNDKIGHAYIFTGTRGTGKTTCAKLFAKAVNCPEPCSGDPCGKCSICTGIDSGSVMDVVEIDAASNNGVDSIRDLRDETAYTPSECAYKVYIIDEVHMLSTAAFNALLKIMEEPPAHVIFILATTEIHKVPATILSRCQRYDFMRISPEDIENRLLYIAQHEDITLTPHAAGLIARLADGAMRDALSILDTCAGVTDQVDDELVRKMAGVTDKSYLFDLSASIADKNAPGALRLVAELREKSVDIKRLCDELIVHYRNLLFAGMPDGEKLLVGVSPEEESLFLEAAQKIRQNDAIRAIRTLCDALDKMGKGTDARIELEVALFKLCEEPAVQVMQTPVYANTPSVQNGPQPFTAVAAGYANPVQMSETIPAAPVTPSGAQTVNTVISMPTENTNSVPAQPEPHAPKAQRDVPKMVQEPQASLSAPPALPDGVAIEPFAQWDQVVKEMESRDHLLYANIKGTKAYYDGKRILIDGGELFLEYMRRNKYSSGLIKQIVAEITGARYGIGPYKTQTNVSAEEQTAEQTLRQLANQGVTVVYENETML